MFSISLLLLPSFASSNCKAATSLALLLVDPPSCLACASSAFISLAANPLTAATLAMLNSKSAAVFTAKPPSAASGIVNDRVKLRPRALVFLPNCFIFRIESPSPLSKRRVFAPIVTIKSFSFAIDLVLLFAALVLP